VPGTPLPVHEAFKVLQLVKALIGRIWRRVEALRDAAFDRYGIPSVRNGRISKVTISRYLPRRAVIVDCGAHDGTDSVDMARRWPDAHIHAFEPVPEVFDRLKANASRHSNITCYPVAISDREGIQAMHISTGGSDGSSSLLAPAAHLEDHPTVLFETIREVHTSTFDAWAAQEGIDHVDLFWLDMQGAELVALRAAPRLLARARAVHSEVSVKNVYHGVPLYPQLREWMEGNGFRVVAEAIPSGWDMGNVLFVRD
jgi:FkbM family methyltransferase